MVRIVILIFGYSMYSCLATVLPSVQKPKVCHIRQSCSKDDHHLWNQMLAG